MPSPTILKSAILSLSLGVTVATATELHLPQIGDSSSGIVSTQKERQIGEVFTKMLYSQIKIEEDPLLNQYVENLVYRLAEASQLQERELTIILIDSPHLNAFAAPGGVIGINTGLFLYAQTEEEFAGVIAHELAHLSQRHYARGVEASQRSTLPTLAALFGSIILAAAGAGDAGMAALSSTIAGAQNAQLAFSRTNEQEADRIGILTMVRANMDPRGMATLFERMSKLDGTGPQYEFLRTHPLSRSRLADTRSRAEQYRIYKPNDQFEYNLMRQRAFVEGSNNLAVLRSRFQKELQSGRTASTISTQYALALLDLKLNNPKTARTALQPLLKQYGNNLFIQILHNNIEFALGNRETSIANIRNLLKQNPNNYPLIMALAEMLYQSGQYQEATKILRAESRKQPQNPLIWYMLAETAGLAKDIIGVHTARAEYFFQVGAMDESVRHLEYAIEQPNIPFSTKSALQERIKEVKAYKNNMKL